VRRLLLLARLDVRTALRTPAFYVTVVATALYAVTFQTILERKSSLPVALHDGSSGAGSVVEHSLRDRGFPVLPVASRDSGLACVSEQRASAFIDIESNGRIAGSLERTDFATRLRIALERITTERENEAIEAAAFSAGESRRALPIRVSRVGMAEASHAPIALLVRIAWHDGSSLAIIVAILLRSSLARLRRKHGAASVVAARTLSAGGLAFGLSLTRAISIDVLGEPAALEPSVIAAMFTSAFLSALVGNVVAGLAVSSDDGPLRARAVAMVFLLNVAAFLAICPTSGMVPYAVLDPASRIAALLNPLFWIHSFFDAPPGARSPLSVEAGLLRVVALGVLAAWASVRLAEERR
jgi:hypothetical protein